jgi:hypothetical protein
MERRKLVFIAVCCFSLASLIVGDASLEVRSSGLSLDVYLKSFTSNLTVVQNNVTEPQFEVGGGGYLAGRSVSSSMLYLQVNADSSIVFGGDGTDANPTGGYLVIQTLTMQMMPSGACLPFLVLRGQRVTFPLSIGVGISNSIGLELNYNCSEVGMSNMSLSMELLNGPRISFGWEKQTSSNRLGFSVGTFVFLPDVAYDGQVLSDWAPETHRIQVSAGVLSTPFNFWMALQDQYQAITQFTVSADPPHCQPYLQGEPNIVSSRPSLALLVYNCSQNGTTLITMHIELAGGFDPLIIEWSKQSGGYREFFLVGTQPGASDVIWWGLTLPLWNDYHFIMHPKIKQTTFYFVMNDPGDSQMVGAPIISYSPDVTDLELTGDLVNGGTINNKVQTLTLTYNCRVQGQTGISVQIPIPGYETALWKWTKQCGTPRSDFSIGTLRNYDDVVSRGVVTFLYSPTLHSAFVFPDASHSTFFLHLESSEHLPITPNTDFSPNEDLALSDGASAVDEVQINVLKVNATHPSCRPFLSGNATVGSTLKSGEFLDLVVTYNCSRPGDTEVTVTIVLDGPYTPIQFTWVKRVGKGPNALMVGTIPNFDDVVSGGVATPLYDPATYTAFYSTRHLKGVFYAQMTQKYAKQEILSVSANSTNAWCKPLVYSSFGTLGSYGTLTHDTTTFTVSWNCLVGGKSMVMVTFDLADWGPLTLAMTVYSGGPRPYLDIGTMKGAADVVMGGTPTPLWIPGPLNGASVSGNVLSTTFWIGLSRANDSQLMSPPVPAYQSQENIIAPYLTGTFGGGWVTSSFDSTVTIVYNCSGLGVVPISIGLILQPYDSITFTWLKICSAARLGFSIGTMLGSNNVVEDGEPTMAWNPLTHVAFVVGTELETRFFVSLSHGSQLITNVTVNSTAPICSPYIIGDLRAGFNLSDTSTSFAVVYNCSNIGSTVIQVTLGLTGNYLPPSFAWTKRVRGLFSGVSVGTSPGAENVIYQGSPTFSYDPISHTQLKTQLPTEFHVTTSIVPLPMQQLQFLGSVAFSLSPWLLPDVSGPLSTPLALVNHSQTTFTVNPHCLLSSELLDDYPTLFVAVTPVPFTPSLFAYFVDCPPNVVGLTVGFDEDMDDVVIDGVPTSSWSPANTSRIQIEADLNILRFWVSADANIPLASVLIAEDGIIITEPLGGGSLAHISSSDQERAFFTAMDEENMDLEAFERRKEVLKELGYPQLPTPACRAILGGAVWDTMKIEKVPHLLQLELNCTVGGTNNVSVILVPEDRSVSSTVWTFSKTMGGFRHGFDIFASPDNFATGTSLQALDDGAPTEDWNPISPVSVQIISSTSASFKLQLDNVYFGRDPTQEFMAPSINVTFLSGHGDAPDANIPGSPSDMGTSSNRPSASAICSPLMFGSAAAGGHLEKDKSLQLHVLSNCYNEVIDMQSIVFEVSIVIPPFTTAVYAWKRQSNGLPPYLSVDGLLSSKSPNDRTPLVRNGIAVPNFEWQGNSFSLWIYADKKGIPPSIAQSPNTTLSLLAPMVNTTTSDCLFVVTGNATDGDALILETGYPLLLMVDTTTCNQTAADFTVTLTTLPYTAPVIIQISKVPPPPVKPKFPGALLGIIIGSTLFVIAAVSIGIYLCLRKPKPIPSTGAYHLRRRKQEQKEALLGNPDMEAIN